MKWARLTPVVWSVLFFILALILTFITIIREDPFLEQQNIVLPPQAPPDIVQIWPAPPPSVAPGEPLPPTPPVFSALGPVLIYFLSSVLVLGLVLFLVPVSVLQKILRGLFGVLFAWGTFIVLILWLPVQFTAGIAIAIGLVWFFIPRVWFHDLVMVVAMTAVGAVFGRFLPPWTSMVLLLILAVYDFLAVRFGYMIWMAKRLSDSNTLPAFVVPKDTSEWNSSMKAHSVTKLVEEKPSERDFSILGGGDIGFPLLLVSSAYFAYGFSPAVILSAFCLVGLIGAYVIQGAFLKGKAMPALPPIAVAALIGLAFVRFVLH